MNPGLVIEIPEADLPIDQRHRRALSRMQFAALLGERLRGELGCEVLVRPTHQPGYRINAPSKRPIRYDDIDRIDAALTDSVNHPEPWRQEAFWSLTWEYPRGADTIGRRGTATWDETSVAFEAVVEVQGPTVLVRLTWADGGASKTFRCRTPFESPNDYAIERVLDRAAYAWLAQNAGPETVKGRSEAQGSRLRRR